MARTPIGRLLVDQGRIDEVQLRSALAHQQKWGGKVGEAMVSLGFVTEGVVLAALARQHGVPVLVLGQRRIPPAILRLVPERLVRERRVLPLAILSGSRRGYLLVATGDPGDIRTLDDVAFASGMEVRAVLAGDADLEQAIERNLSGKPPPPRPRAVDLPDADEWMQVVPVGHGPN
jgi:type IV pilus assembly protein PilB